MTMLNQKVPIDACGAFDPVAYQRQLCPEDRLQALARSEVPSPDRFFRVAAGLARWTVAELQAIRKDPALQEYERQMIAQVRAICPPDDADLNTAVIPALARTDRWEYWYPIPLAAASFEDASRQTA